MSRKTNKGLFVGIDAYEQLPELRGCVNDAIGLASVLERDADGKPNFDSSTITNPSKSSLESAIQELFNGDADIALFYFAGHGCVDNTTEEGVICPVDANPLVNDKMIRLSDILYWSSQSGAKNAIIILDCCQSGSIGECRTAPPQTIIIREGMTILTACKRHESAAEVDGQGVFTKLAIEALHGGAANILGQITPASVYSFVDNALGAWDQRPCFKTNVSQFVILREVAPRVEPEILRELPKWFTNKNDIYELNPTFEFTQEGCLEENVEIFKKLQKCSQNGLIVPVGAEHMYFAAINSTGCQLTALGLYYWDLAVKGRF